MLLYTEIKDKYNQAIGRRDNVQNNLSIELEKLKSLNKLEENIDLAAVILQFLPLLLVLLNYILLLFVSQFAQQHPQL